MTKKLSFLEAFECFMGIAYPSYPQTRVMQDWNSRLLALDAEVAGYATRLAKGDMEAAEIPRIRENVKQVENLSRDLDLIISQSLEEDDLLAGYRAYVAALGELVTAISELAGTEQE